MVGSGNIVVVSVRGVVVSVRSMVGSSHRVASC